MNRRILWVQQVCHKERGRIAALPAILLQVHQPVTSRPMVATQNNVYIIYICCLYMFISGLLLKKRKKEVLGCLRCIWGLSSHSRLRVKTQWQSCYWNVFITSSGLAGFIFHKHGY